jgi:antitoxin (DNA-binding transcriptional repressor) of toxin-antitoxin stability system
MKSIGVRELKQNARQVMSQVEGGETFIVTVQGRVVGQFVPAARATWASAEQMMSVLDVPVDAGFWDDINAARDASVQDDPWERD